MRRHGRRATTAALFLVVSALPGCAQDEPLVSLPDEYLGQWYYLGSSGGIAGTGMGDEATGWIVIRSDNTIVRYDDDGAQLAVDSFTLTRGPSIFSTDEVWLLHTPGSLERVIQIDGGDQMSLSDNAYDGFQLSYARSRS
jgi:hypothetical protein